MGDACRVLHRDWNPITSSQGAPKSLTRALEPPEFSLTDREDLDSKSCCPHGPPLTHQTPLLRPLKSRQQTPPHAQLLER
ncbi:hypothetical protein D623_10002529 [Myotis brandtii]|uniref:Uncharacterized protein n=1 Tax=Myotis brandtii TaxID=109478 RepID=S7Q388_MYOBR|nr:hypothetical protein D623_10002529 [Myotis brandtii]